MQEYAEKEGSMSQLRRLLISGFDLTNSTINTPLLQFYLELGLECRRFYRFAEHTPAKGFNDFLQSAVNARRQGIENPNSSVVAEIRICLQTLCMAIELWIVVAIQIQGTRNMNWHLQRSTINCLGDWDLSTTNFT